MPELKNKKVKSKQQEVKIFQHFLQTYLIVNNGQIFLHFNRILLKEWRIFFQENSFEN